MLTLFQRRYRPIKNTSQAKLGEDLYFRNRFPTEDTDDIRSPGP